MQAIHLIADFLGITSWADIFRVYKLPANKNAAD
jgi:hypothetical protein